MTDLACYAFLREALHPTEGLRAGQKLMNDLYRCRSDLYDRFYYFKKDVDPYYSDEVLWVAVEWVKKNW